MHLNRIVLELKVERKRIDEAISLLEGRQSHGVGSRARNVTSIDRGRRRQLSAAARRRISEAQKRRWAEQRKKAA